MKTRIHRWMLGIMLLLLMPGTLLACLLLIGAIGSGFQHGFRAGDAAAIAILLVPPVLIWRGLWLMAGLGQGVHAALRRHLLAFHLAVLVYCSFWLFTTAKRGGFEFAIFPGAIQITGTAILIIPVLITLFTEPEEKREWNPRPRTLGLNNSGTRFISWLASRIR